MGCAASAAPKRLALGGGAPPAAGQAKQAQGWDTSRLPSAASTAPDSPQSGGAARAAPKAPSPGPPCPVDDAADCAPVARDSCTTAASLSPAWGPALPEGTADDLEPDWAKSGRPLFVLDWDDTILPTSWLAATGSPCSCSDQRSSWPNPAQVAHALRPVEAAALHLVQVLAELGDVVLLTNADERWVARTSELYMPNVACQLYRSIPVVARADGSEQDRSHKQRSLHALLDHYQPSRVLSFGDGEDERAACLEAEPGAAWPSLTAPPVSVLLAARPSCSTLLRQLQALADCAPRLLDLEPRLDGTMTFADSALPAGRVSYRVHPMA